MKILAKLGQLWNGISCHFFLGKKESGEEQRMGIDDSFKERLKSIKKQPELHLYMGTASPNDKQV